VHDGQSLDQLENIRHACRAEISKIKGLLRDLVDTTTQLDTELTTIRVQYSEQSSLFESTTMEITTRLAPAAKKYELELTEAMSIRDRLSHAEVLQTRVAGLQT
jgi:hypothetical protein